MIEGEELARRVCVALAAAMFVVSSLAAGQTAGAPLQPAKPWNLDYGDTQCVAAREYGREDDPIMLLLRPAPNGETYELLVGRRQAGPALALERQGSVDFGGGPISAWTLQYGDKKSVVDQFRISKAAMEAARTASHVILRIRGGADASFALSNMPKLLDGLQKCTADLMNYWNEGGEKAGKISQRAEGQVRRIFSSDDFPQEAMTRSQEGSSTFLLLIDEQGKVAGCHVVQTSGIPVFDARGCQVIRERAKFKPALDAKGKPVRSMYETPQVIWRLGNSNTR
jgi:TonB family protein